MNKEFKKWLFIASLIIFAGFIYSCAHIFSVIYVHYFKESHVADWLPRHIFPKIELI